MITKVESIYTQIVEAEVAFIFLFKILKKIDSKEFDQILFPPVFKVYLFYHTVLRSQECMSVIIDGD